MKRKFKLVSLLMALILAAGLISAPVWAAETTEATATETPEATASEAPTASETPEATVTEAETAEAPVESINVTVRVESGMAGKEETLIAGTMTVLSVNPLLSSFQATPYDALVQAADGDVEFSESDLGVFLTGVRGVSDETGAYTWMYAVNNKLPDVGIDSYMLKDGDEVVFYFASWENADYSYFTPSKLNVAEGESFSLKLNAVDFTEGEYPVEGAQIIITSDSPTTRELNYTDAEGNVELSFFAPGSYEISAAKLDDEGVPLISRPYCVVTVGGAAIDGENTTTDSAIDAADATTGSGIGAADEPAAETPGGFDLENIQPMPMPTAKISYDALTKTLTVFDKNVDINGLQVIHGPGELYLPLRAVAETMGAMVTWNAETATATITIGSGSTSAAELDANEAVASGEIRLIEDRIYVPSAYILQIFGE